MKHIHYLAWPSALIFWSISLNAELHNYIWANYQEFNNNMPAAEKRYMFFLNSNNSSIYAVKGYICFLYKTKQHQKIAALKDTIINIFKEDAELHVILIHALRATGQTMEADKHLVLTHTKFPHHPQIALEMANALIISKDLRKALTIIDTFLNHNQKKQPASIFHFIKSQIYIQLKEPNNALVSIKECLDAHSSFDKGWLVRAMLEEQLGHVEKAIKGYSTFLGLTGGKNTQIARHLIDLSLQQKIVTQKRNQGQQLFKKALAAFEKKEYPQAVSDIEQCLAYQPLDIQSRLLKVRILNDMQQFNHTIALLVNWIKQDPNNELWFEALHLVGCNQAQQANVIKTLERLIKTHPNCLWCHLYLADLYIRTEQTAAAIKTLSSIMPKLQNNPLQADVRFQLSVLHFKIGSHAIMITLLNEGLALDKDHVPTKNLLAYYYATKGNDLIKAQDLVTPLIAAEPENIHILDTQAVILYKNKQYTQAHALLSRLHAQEPRDVTILTNKAKTEHKLGRTEAAMLSLNEAKKVAHSTYEKGKIEKILAKYSQK